MRATAAAVDEGALDLLHSDTPTRTLIWVADGGPARAAGTSVGGRTRRGQRGADRGGVRAAAVDRRAGCRRDRRRRCRATLGAGDGRSDRRAPRSAGGPGWRRTKAPLRDVTAGRAAVLAPRLSVPDEFGMTRYLAAGAAVLAVVDKAVRVDIGALADELDAEALRNSAARELFTNPAKTLAERLVAREVVLAGDSEATLALGPAQRGGAAARRAPGGGRGRFD